MLSGTDAGGAKPVAGAELAQSTGYDIMNHVCNVALFNSVLRFANSQINIQDAVFI